MITAQENRMEIKINNHFIVPYNRAWLRSLRAHVKVELCSLVKVIKYVLKYVIKGTDGDLALYAHQGENSKHDEIKAYRNHHQWKDYKAS